METRCRDSDRVRRDLGILTSAIARVFALAAVFALIARAASRLRSPIARYAVEGASMEPAYHSGDRVLVNRLAYLRREPRPGEVVVLRDPERSGRHLLKRVAVAPAGEVQPRTHVYILGDNAAESRDSRAFGSVPRAAIIGRAWRTY